MSETKRIDISLVLGSGGARGLAHIGVIRWLEEHHYNIRSIVGCSMGACIGGIYAIGKLDEYEEWIRAVRKRDIVSLLDVTFGGGGLVKGDKLFNTLRTLLGDDVIESLPIQFTAVATDIDHVKEVWIKEGPVFDAIRASVSIPFLFTPVMMGNRQLVDGAVLNPVPTAPTMMDSTDLTIAVNASGEIKQAIRHIRKTQRPNSHQTQLQEKITNFLEGIRISRKSDERKSSISDVVYQSFDAMQSTIARQKLASNPADILIDIPRNICHVMDFDRADEIIEIGYHLAETVMFEKMPAREIPDKNSDDHPDDENISKEVLPEG